MSDRLIEEMHRAEAGRIMSRLAASRKELASARIIEREIRHIIRRRSDMVRNLEHELGLIPSFRGVESGNALANINQK